MGENPGNSGLSWHPRVLSGRDVAEGRGSVPFHNPWKLLTSPARLLTSPTISPTYPSREIRPSPTKSAADLLARRDTQQESVTMTEETLLTLLFVGVPGLVIVLLTLGLIVQTLIAAV